VSVFFRRDIRQELTAKKQGDKTRQKMYPQKKKLHTKCCGLKYTKYEYFNANFRIHCVDKKYHYSFDVRLYEKHGEYWY
jgi:hypothetical protein